MKYAQRIGIVKKTIVVKMQNNNLHEYWQEVHWGTLRCLWVETE
jgi:hypothetical protein